VLEKLDNLISQLKEVETAESSYLITGEKRYLDPYNTAVPVINQKLKDLRKLTADNLQQQYRIDIIEQKIRQKLALGKDTIDSRQNQGIEAARQLLLTDNDKNLMNDIRRIIAGMQNEERTLLQQRSQKTQVAIQQSINTIIYGVPLAFFLLTLIGIYLTRNISKPLREISGVTEKLQRETYQ